MTKRFTIGVTTHNEEATIATLLDSLLGIPLDEVDVIFYDDCSDDDTRAIIEAHPIARQSNFHAHFANFNNGTPSIGRTYIGQNAKTEYVALIDGDDNVDVAEFRRLIKTAPSGYEILLTAFTLRGKIPKLLSAPMGPIKICSESAQRLISGIGGKVYARGLLERHGPDRFKARSDDARLNIRILMAESPKIYNLPEICFYHIEDSRKSTKVANINFEEIEERVANYLFLENRFNLDRRYLFALKRHLTTMIREATDVDEGERAEMLRKCAALFPFPLKRIVFLTTDISAIGGISGRLQKIMRAAPARSVEYACISKHDYVGLRYAGLIVTDQDASAALTAIGSWSESDTVIVTANNIMRSFGKDIQRALSRFPLIYMGSGQMAFFIQDSTILSDLDYVRSFKASANISLSNADIAFQRQLGVYGQTKGFLPVDVREQNTFNPAHNQRLGYVGRIDFHAKGCERLVDIARALKANGLPPIKVFTTNRKNSPDYPRFIQMVEAAGLADHFDITLQCTDKDIIYHDISMLLLPSKKESWGNVVLEAYSYGIPVISTTYAPGPAELIEHGRTGYLLDDFSGNAVIELMKSMDEAKLRQMSLAAFEKHKSYSMEAHFEFLEKVATDVLNSFTGKNELPVFPDLKLVRGLPNGERPVTKLDIQIPKPTPEPAPVAITPAMTRKEYVENRLAPLATEIAKLERRRERLREKARGGNA